MERDKKEGVEENEVYRAYKRTYFNSWGNELFSRTDSKEETVRKDAISNEQRAKRYNNLQIQPKKIKK